jgi:hypothetical protein
MSLDLQVLIRELSTVVKRDLNILAVYESRLRGPLMATVDETSLGQKKPNNPSNNGYGKNWNNLVQQMEIGVGEYAVEVLRLS